MDQKTRQALDKEVNRSRLVGQEADLRLNKMLTGLDCTISDQPTMGVYKKRRAKITSAFYNRGTACVFLDIYLLKPGADRQFIGSYSRKDGRTCYPLDGIIL